jgi:hypothetical protein
MSNGQNINKYCVYTSKNQVANVNFKSMQILKRLQLLYTHNVYQACTNNVSFGGYGADPSL